MNEPITLALIGLLATALPILLNRYILPKHQHHNLETTLRQELRQQEQKLTQRLEGAEAKINRQKTHFWQLVAITHTYQSLLEQILNRHQEINGQTRQNFQNSRHQLSQLLNQNNTPTQ